MNIFSILGTPGWLFLCGHGTAGLSFHGQFPNLWTQVCAGLATPCTLKVNSKGAGLKSISASVTVAMETNTFPGPDFLQKVNCTQLFGMPEFSVALGKK